MSEHFGLDELVRSDIGQKFGIQNEPNIGQIQNLNRLADELLEPTRILLGVPMHINSGFRSQTINTLVNGRRNSAHLDGRAADFYPIGMMVGEAHSKIFMSGLIFDQCILEHSWIHISIPRFGEAPRRMAFHEDNVDAGNV